MSLNEIMLSLEIGLIYGIIAIGIYLTFRVIDFPDLTCDGSFVLGSAVSATLIKAGISPWLSLVAATGAGGIAGALTSVLHLKFRITSLLSGILVSFMLYSINLRIMGGIPNISLVNNDTLFPQDSLITLVLIGLTICIIITYILITDFGLALRSIGKNKRLAQISGINVAFMITIGLVFGNAIIALGGALFTQHQGYSDVGSGIGTVIVGLASVMIGERIMPYRSILVQTVSCLIGSVTYKLFISFALHSDSLGFTTSDLNLITGIMVIAIMHIPKKSRRVIC